jgi:hypothetical protein
MSYDDWPAKQDRFLRFLGEHRADEAPYRVDLEKKKIYWVDNFGLSLVVADCKVLLSFALSNHSVMMGWMNGSLPPGSYVDNVDGMDDIYPDCEPQEVWELAMRAATAAGAEAIYRTPSPQSWVMLALWNLRPGGAEQFTSGSPRAHILQVVESLMNHPSFEERQILLDNYAESFLQMASHPYKGTEYDEPLKDAARLFRNLLVHENEEEQNRGLAELRMTWMGLSDEGSGS